ncbi:MAG: hypothetical protein KDD60_09425, partial [Bdellovibrionales bacterium]|nr:hypothetical protein [Bdellovibrionales bacterium]
MESRETESTTEALETEQALDREETTSTVLSDKEMQEISKQSAERVEEKLKRIASTDEQTAIRTTDSPASKGTHEGAVRGEVSASTVARMMGLATANEVAMLEGKIDLLSSRVSNATTKLERLFSVLDRLPTAADMDRVD